MVSAFPEVNTRRYTIPLLMETLSPVSQGVMEAMPLKSAGDDKVKVRKIRSVATVFSREELGWARSPGASEAENTEIPTVTDRHAILAIPVLGANALRHKIRAALADHLLATCELTVADFAKASKTAEHMYHLLYSGGGLTKDEKPDNDFWRSDTIQRIYREWPIISLLGASYNGNMLKGKLSVGQGYPLVTRILSRFFSDPDTAYALFPAHQWIDIHPASLIQGRSVEDLWTEYRHPDGRLPQDKGSSTRNMIMQMQYIPVGVPFGSTLTVSGATPLDASALHWVLQHLAAPGVLSFGGKLQSGMGHLSVTPGFPDAMPTSDLYDQYVQDHRDALRQAVLAQGPWKKGMLHASVEEADV